MGPLTIMSSTETRNTPLPHRTCLKQKFAKLSYQKNWNQLCLFSFADEKKIQHLMREGGQQNLRKEKFDLFLKKLLRATKNTIGKIKNCGNVNASDEINKKMTYVFKGTQSG